MSSRSSCESGAAHPDARAIQLAIRADDHHAIVRQTAQDVPIPLPDERVWHHDEGTPTDAAFTLDGHRRDAREGLANACVERIEPAVVVDQTTDDGALVRLEHDLASPASDLQRRALERRSDEAGQDIAAFDLIDSALVFEQPVAKVQRLGCGIGHPSTLERFLAGFLLALVIDDLFVGRLEELEIQVDPAKQHRLLVLAADPLFEEGIRRALVREQRGGPLQLGDRLAEHFAHPRAQQVERHPRKPRTWINLGDRREPDQAAKSVDLGSGQWIVFVDDGATIALADQTRVVVRLREPDRRIGPVLGEACPYQLGFQRCGVWIAKRKAGAKIAQRGFGKRSALPQQPCGGVGDRVAAAVSRRDLLCLGQRLGDLAVRLPHRQQRGHAVYILVARDLVQSVAGGKRDHVIEQLAMLGTGLRKRGEASLRDEVEVLGDSTTEQTGPEDGFG